MEAVLGLCRRLLSWRSRMRIRVVRLADVTLLEVTGKVGNEKQYQPVLDEVSRTLSPQAEGKVVLSLAKAKLGRQDDFSDFIVAAYNSLPKDPRNRLKVVTDRGRLEHHLKVWFGVDGSEAIFSYYNSVEQAVASFASR